MAFALWRWDNERFKTYAFAFIGTLYIGLLTSAILPTAPPWMAAQLGHIPHVYQVFPDIAGEVSPGTYERGYELAGANPVAAMPSLHSAIPFLMAIALWKYRWVRWAGVAYAGSMLFSVVYLGEHYAVDAFAGWAAAGACWAGAKAVQRRGETGDDEAPKPKETAAQARPGYTQVTSG
jgi:membrane-associated phospholipid phosphatase